MTRIFCLILAYFFIALAILGAFLPLLPTVPFLILAAWFASKGSKRLHDWLYAHPLFGKLLQDWEEQGAVSRKSKILAVSMMAASWLFLFFYLPNPWALVGVSITFILVSTYLITRPEPV